VARLLLLPLLKIVSAFLETAISVNVVQTLSAWLAGVIRRVLTTHIVPRVDATKIMPRIQHAPLGFALKMEQRIQHAGLGIALKLGQRIRRVLLGIAAKIAKGPWVRHLVFRAIVAHHHIDAQDRTRTLLFPLKVIASAILEDVIRQDVVHSLLALLAGVLRMVLTAQHAPLGIALKLGQRIQHAGLGIALKLGQRVRCVWLGFAAKKGPRVRQLVWRDFVAHQHAQDRTRTLLFPL